MKNSVLVLIPLKDSMHPTLKSRAFDLAQRMIPANPDLDLALIFDYRVEPRHVDDLRPWSKVTRIRNRMLDAYNVMAFNYVLWIDADVVEYPADMPTRLIAANPTGITAPMILIEGSNRFYDVAAYVQHGRSHIMPKQHKPWVRGRNLMHDPPYWDYSPTEELVPMDGVGTICMVPSEIYKDGVRYTDHPAYTDHFAIMAEARVMCREVIVHRGIIAYHADLPKYGEAWH